jgi:predicted O-methyltransferase YrrM
MTAVMDAPTKIPGWFHHGSKILELIQQHRPMVCVELGTWQGASAVPVARLIQRWGGTLTCVDTWSGQLDEHGGSLAGKPPNMILGFARTVIDAGVAANVRLIPATTAEAAKVWSEPIDFLYIDADHSYEGVLADLYAWVPHVRSGGLILGDDYGNAIYPGVKWAWDAYERAHGFQFERFQSDPPAAQGTQLIYGVWE